MKESLTYIEKELKNLLPAFPDCYDHVMEGEELSAFIMNLMEKYSNTSDRHSIYEESQKIITGDFFEEHSKEMIYNQLDHTQAKEYEKTFARQTEESFIRSDYDISCSRQIRYMPAQWHYTYYFQVYYALEEPCDVYFRNNEKLTIRKGDFLILSPFVEHATPCYADGKILEHFLIRSSTFDRVFWEQLNSATIMSHFFRTALRNDDHTSVSYLLFHTENDADLQELTVRIKKEINEKLRYSSQLANSLMSVLFCLLLRRYEDSVLLPSMDNLKWKAEFTRIFSYIQNNYASTSLKEIAVTFNYSTKQIGRIIRHYFNMSYTELITFLKMDHAVTMLKENTMSMEEIAAALGYSDLSSFYRAFRKYYRDTPVNYLKSE